MIGFTCLHPTKVVEWILHGQRFLCSSQSAWGPPSNTCCFGWILLPHISAAQLFLTSPVLWLAACQQWFQGPTASGIRWPENFWKWITQNLYMGNLLACNSSGQWLKQCTDLQFCTDLLLTEIAWLHLQDPFPETLPQSRSLCMSCYDDCIKWVHSNIYDDCNVPSKVFLYMAGFPCKPFSSLHWQSDLLAEESAKPMFRVLDNIAAAEPPAAWL